MHPLVANIFGFLVAFLVSYQGHSRLTFKDPRKKKTTSLKEMARFFIVALAGFALNQTLFYLLLTYSSWGVDLSLGITLIVVSGSTYVFSKLWAFKMLEE